MNELHLFAGIGGGILGGQLLGHTTVCAVEIEPYCRKVLLQRQRDGILPRFPIWDDVRTFDGIPWRGRVDIVCGGFPCQDISVAGKGAGIDGERSGLWSEMRRIICEVRPRIVFVENSPALTYRGLGRVLGDLARLGYDAEWGVLGAGHLGFAHQRARLWVFAHADSDRLEGGAKQRTAQGWDIDTFRISSLVASHSRLPVSDPRAFGERYGFSRNVERIRAIGNAQVPAVAATAFGLLSEGRLA